MIKVGNCGWSYLSAKKYFGDDWKEKFLSKLQAYAKLFQLVELNSSFYRIPKLTTAERWRKEVDMINPNFEFTIKCSRIISHEDKFSSKTSIWAFNQMKKIAHALRTKILLLQTPASFRPTKENLDNVKNFFKNIKREDFILVWEVRWQKNWTKEIVNKLFSELDITQCLAPKTKILLDNYSWLTIKEIENNHKKLGVISCDWSNKTIQSTNLMHYLRLNPGNKIYRIVTRETKRSVLATSDHPFYTQRGKIPLKKLKVGDRLAVYPFEGVKHVNKFEDRVIISEEDIRNAMSPAVKSNSCIRQLKEKNLLPLTMKNEKLPILARLLGHVFGDGCMTYTLTGKYFNCYTAFTGKPEDLKIIADDIRRLGFRSSKIMSKYSESEVNVSGKKHIIKGTSNQIRCTLKSFWILLKTLGAPVGDKALCSVSIPNWIKKAPLYIQKEFLAAYFGSELEKPILDKKYGKNFQLQTLTLYKSEELLYDALEFVRDLKKILGNFGVKISSISIREGSRRNDGIKTKKIELRFSNHLMNFLNLFGKIGYRYCKQREILSNYAFEYLLMKYKAIEKRKKLYQRVLHLKKRGFGYTSIVKEFSKEVKPDTLRNWFYRQRRIFNKMLSRDFPRFTKWIKRATIGLKNGGFVWETIESISEKKMDDVRDLTTVNKTHNFIANGFLVGNCVDPFRQDCFFAKDLFYYRLHGLGKPSMYRYQFSDNELKDLEKKVKTKKKDVYVLFNNYSCYEDALKFMEFLK